MTNRFPTRVDIPAEVCDELATFLNQAYATTVVLASQVRQARLTVRGPGSTELQRLFAEMTDNLYAQADALARRTAHIGGAPQLTVRAAAAASTLPDWDHDQHAAAVVVEAVGDRFELHASALRRLVEMSAQHDEPGTRHVLTVTATEVEADLWRLDSYLAD